MSCSTSFFSRPIVVLQFLILALVPGCALLQKPRGAPVELQSLVAEEGEAHAGRAAGIRWRASATGGTGELSFRFETSDGSVQIVEQEGRSPTWYWTPRERGAFRARVVVTDGTGAHVEGDWSPPYLVLPPVHRESAIAVLPVQNLTGGKAPVETVGRLLRDTLAANGFKLVREQDLERVLYEHRIRHTGSVDSEASRSIEEGTGAEAILLTSLEAYQDANPPRISLISRLVLSGREPEIVWMDTVALAGDEAPGLLDLGRIDRPDILMNKALTALVDSLAQYLPQTGGPARERIRALPASVDAAAPETRRRARARHQPQMFFRSPIIDSSRRYVVAVLPFLNRSERKSAGKIVMLHVIDQLRRSPRFTVAEPGLVREELLEYRIIMKEGPSFADADIISSRTSLAADLVLWGTVFYYQDTFAVPKVDFEVKVLERKSREIVWASRSHNTGDEAVLFYDLGRIHTAGRLASEMARATVDVLTR